MSEVSAAIDSEVAPPPPWWAPFTLAAFVGLVIATNFANAVWARWVNDNPEGLLVLSSRNRYLALTLAAGVPLLSFIVIAFLRLGAAFAVCHSIGRAYGATAVGWFKRYLGVTPEAIDAFNRGFDKAEWALIPFFAGSNIVAALTGVHRTPLSRLIPLWIIGVAGRVVLMWWLARTFERQLVDFLEWLQRYQWWAVGLSVAAVAFVNVRNMRRG